MQETDGANVRPRLVALAAVAIGLVVWVGFRIELLRLARGVVDVDFTATFTLAGEFWIGLLCAGAATFWMLSLWVMWRPR